jgi:Protein of unknown function (DUF3761)
MHVSRSVLGLAAGMLAALVVQAQMPSGAPAGTTGQCKDGSYYAGATKQGACRGHKGVKDWYGATAAAAPAPVAAPAAASASSRRSSAKDAPASMPTTMTTGPAPSGATGQCNDGSYYGGATKKGACRGHKGVKDWYSAESAPAAAPVVAPAARYTPPAVAMAGGGAGQVWVNNKTKVYHCQSDSFYGKTKDGAYMTEAAARSAGDRPARGKSCQ